MVGSIPAWAGQPFERPQGCRQPLPVYPRVGGATQSPGRPHQPGLGLSPRGRGNPGGRATMIVDRGSIPAWAGQPYKDRVRLGCLRVYPRVGGATWCAPRLFQPVFGLSPRGRGNLRRERRQIACTWSIPAWAGQPTLRLEWEWRCWVYPRVGGQPPFREYQRGLIISSDD